MTNITLLALITGSFSLLLFLTSLLLNRMNIKNSSKMAEHLAKFIRDLGLMIFALICYYLIYEKQPITDIVPLFIVFLECAILGIGCVHWSEGENKDDFI